MKITKNSRGFTRRDFIRATSAVLAAAAAPGCVTNEATGRQQLMLHSEESEVAFDKSVYPRLITESYGIYNDSVASKYISELGARLAAASHRPTLPWQFKIVNNVEINAWALRGGSIAMNRGILLFFKDEAELAAVIGHEIGHVNARHGSEGDSQRLMAEATLQIAASNMGGVDKNLAGMMLNISSFVAEATLMKYSRVMEFEADALGMEYCNKIGINPNGQVDVQAKIGEMEPKNQSLFRLLQRTHPTGVERVGKAMALMNEKYSSFKDIPRNKERYMDNIANVRRNKKSIMALQDGWSQLQQGQVPMAQMTLVSVLKKAPEDYMALILLAEVQNGLEQYKDGLALSSAALKLSPSEPLAERVIGTSLFHLQQYDKAYQFLHDYDSKRPGIPVVFFFKGVCKDALGQREEAASIYFKYVTEIDNTSEMAAFAVGRLESWGLIATK